jgi:hypothetical protein
MAIDRWYRSAVEVVAAVVQYAVTVHEQPPPGAPGTCTG